MMHTLGIVHLRKSVSIILKNCIYSPFIENIFQLLQLEKTPVGTVSIKQIRLDETAAKMKVNMTLF